jgi:hypothetical protein
VAARLWVTAYAPRVKRQAFFEKFFGIIVPKAAHEKAGTMTSMAPASAHGFRIIQI